MSTSGLGAILHTVEKVLWYSTGLNRRISCSIIVHHSSWDIRNGQEVFKARFFEDGVNVPCVRVFVFATSDKRLSIRGKACGGQTIFVLEG
jgi:hypothetical protein